MSSQSNSSSSSQPQTPPEPPSEVYLAQLHQHFTSSRLHTLEGKTEDELLPPSLFPPNAHWTSQEKDLFFHALSIHSRLRPDLIARDIKSKTLVDVCIYLDMLDEGLEDIDDLEAQETRKKSQGSVNKSIRDNLPIAMEMTEQWCQFEIQQASLIAASQEKFHEQWLAQCHEEELEAKRKEVRAPDGGARDANNKRDRRGEKMRGKVIKEWLEEREEEWKVEERLERLGGGELRVMDMIVRAGEEKLNANEVEDGEMPKTRSVSPAQESLRTSEEPQAGGRFQLVNADEDYVDSTEPTSSIGPPSSRSQATTDDYASPEYILTLSPKSRRRFQKRMYMRRKRAQTSGRTIENDPGRLKPGRKADFCATRSQKKVRVQVEESDGEDAPSVAASRPPQSEVGSSEAVRATRHPHKSGKTKTYKTLAELEEIGMTHEALKEEGLDLFRFRVFHGLMKTYQTLHDDQLETEPQISLTLLSTLRAAVVVFVYEVVKRAMTLTEQDLRAKSHTRVWRKTENKYVTQRDVEAAVRLIGAEGLDRKKHFEMLLQRLGSDTGENDGDDAEEGDADDPENSEQDRPDQNPNTHSDSDEESWLGDGEESDGDDPESSTKPTDGREAPSEGSPSPSVRSHLSRVSSVGSGIPLDQEELVRKNELLGMMPIARRVNPPFIRLPWSYRRDREDAQNESIAPRRSRSRGDPGPKPSSSRGRDRKAPSSGRNSVQKQPTDDQGSSSGSLYEDTSSESSESTDLLPKTDDEDDTWLASENKLNSKDSRKEKAYERALWALIASGDINQVFTFNDNQSDTHPKIPVRTKRKRKDDSSEEEEEAEETGESQAPNPKRRKTRSSTRRRKQDTDTEAKGQSDGEGNMFRKLRYAPPGTGRIKSAVYISDSYSDNE